LIDFTFTYDDVVIPYPFLKMFDVDITAFRNLELHVDPDVLRSAVISIELSLCLIKHRCMMEYWGGGVKICVPRDEAMLSSVMFRAILKRKLKKSENQKGIFFFFADVNLWINVT
jgi:hypothetical protein